MINSNKENIRKKFLKTRMLLSEKYLKASNNVITKKIIFFIKRYNLKSIGIYISTNNEVLTDGVISYCLENDIKVYIPNCSIETNDMEYKEIRNINEDIELNTKLNVMQAKQSCPTLIETDKMQAIFMPLIAFDRKLTRVGSGKGYYDRWIVVNNYQGYKIGVSQQTQLTNKIIKADEHDVPMNFCITEKEVFIPIMDEDDIEEMDFDVTFWRLNDDEIEND